MSARVFRPWKLYLFAALSVLDFFLTCWLLRHGNGFVSESNPLANWWLRHFGWIGLAGFKAGVAFLAASLFVVIASYRPHTGARLAGFACAALTAVVLYSGYLCWSVATERTDLLSDESPLVQQGRRLDSELIKSKTYRDLLEQLTRDVVARRCTLAQAARILAESERAKDPTWRAQLLSLYRHPSYAACLAANLCDHAVMSLRDQPHEAREVARRLQAELQAQFGRQATMLRSV